MQRVGKNWTGNDRDYVYTLGGQLLHETTATGNQDYVWLNGELIGVVTSATPASTKYLAAIDQIGTPTRLYGSDGKPKWAADYEAFGKATTYVPGKTYAPSVEMNIRFPGQYFDAETGMHYNWYRYYDPNSGRYLQADPIIGLAVRGFVPGTAVAPNRSKFLTFATAKRYEPFGYVRNNPAIRIDPTGLYGTNDCSYYGGKCDDDSTYYCSIAPAMCKFFDDDEPDPDPERDDDYEGFYRCTRRCLQDCDKACGGPVECHVGCWYECFFNDLSGNPF